MPARPHEKEETAEVMYGQAVPVHRNVSSGFGPVTN
jgi:hypothetical protein